MKYKDNQNYAAPKFGLCCFKIGIICRIWQNLISVLKDMSSIFMGTFDSRVKGIAILSTLGAKVIGRT